MRAYTHSNVRSRVRARAPSAASCCLRLAAVESLVGRDDCQLVLTTSAVAAEARPPLPLSLVVTVKLLATDAYIRRVRRNGRQDVCYPQLSGCASAAAVAAKELDLTSDAASSIERRRVRFDCGDKSAAETSKERSKLDAKLFVPRAATDTRERSDHRGCGDGKTTRGVNDLAVYC